ncbi:pyruvate kinase [bacterium]|nr:pyruvate kinase [bacterium]
MKNNRKTKIIATVGPASKKAVIINQLIKSGVNIFRFNLKYDTPAGHSRNIDVVRKEAQKLGQIVQVLIDLPRPFFLKGNGLVLEKEPDYVALSHVKKVSNITRFKKFCKKNKLTTNVIAKIETKESLSNFARIINETDSLMIARGDLGKSIPIEQVPFVQKEIVLACNKSGKIVIVATEMLLSIVLNKEPTRAEVSDVANAVLEGGDAVMLSEETAVGKNPVEAVRIMNKVIIEAENWQKLGYLHIFSIKNKKFIFGA